MSTPARETYLESVSPERAPIVLALDRAITTAYGGFDVGIYYRQLTYALGRDFRRWVCAIDAHPKNAVCLRFLYGYLMDDPRRVFRGAKTSPLRTIDIPSQDDVDATLIAEYVSEAVSRFDEFKASTPPSSRPRA